MKAKKESGSARLSRIAKENSRLIRQYEKAHKKHKTSPDEYITKMENDQNVIEFDQLRTYFFSDMGIVQAVDGVTFSIPVSKTVGVVGESGCGKSVTAMSIMGLVQRPTGQIVGGAIRYNNGECAVDMTRIPIEAMQRIRGNEIAMIFQEPMTSLNPVFTIGRQLDESIRLHNPRLSKKEIYDRSVEMLAQVGMARPEGIYRSYPHELSGGMRQRVMIAMALSCDPRLIIADEPTTALDVTIQAQILDLLRNLKDKINASIMLITHDLGVVAEMADYVVVMYAGRVIEQGTARDIFHDPLHPYTKGLLGSKPVLGRETERLYSIPGNVPNPIDMPEFCYFRDRCDRCVAMCQGAYPDVTRVSETHSVSCYLHKNSAVGGEGRVRNG